MSELDIPQISIARYLELLKRRWWSVIPVTVIGLIVGGVAAFLVPRYYVAETDFIFHSRQTIEELWIEGIPTTVSLHRRILEHARFARGRFSTSFIEDHFG